MSATLIRTEIDRLFGDMSRDNRTALRDMRTIAAHASQYAEILDDEDDEDDFDDESGDYFYDDEDDFDYDDVDATEGDLY